MKKSKRTQRRHRAAWTGGTPRPQRVTQEQEREILDFLSGEVESILPFLERGEEPPLDIAQRSSLAARLRVNAMELSRRGWR